MSKIFAVIGVGSAGMVLIGYAIAAGLCKVTGCWHPYALIGATGTAALAFMWLVGMSEEDGK